MGPCGPFSLEEIPSLRFRMNSVLKLLVGGGVIGLAAWKLPLLEIFSLFFYIVIVPLALFAAVGLIGSSTMEMMAGYQDDLLNAIDIERQKLANKVSAHSAQAAHA